MSDTKIIELAKKLHALAERGEGGEKRNAAQVLQAFLKKHNMNLEDILENEVAKRMEFKIRREQKEFLHQIYTSVVGNRSTWSYKYEKRKVNITIMVDCTTSEFIETQAKFEFYWLKYKEEQEIFYNAFIQKNRLWCKENPDKKKSEDREPLSSEERRKLFKMANMMEGMEQHQFLKQLDKQS